MAKKKKKKPPHPLKKEARNVKSYMR